MQVLNDARIDVRVDGSGSDTVVLIHGFPLSKEMWNAQVDALAPLTRVIAIDLRGMGASSLAPGPYLMETLAGDVAAVLDATDVRRATLVGHSLGGYVALAFARMYLERLERLALVCSRIGADTAERAAARRAQADDMEKNNASHAIVDAMMNASLAPQTRERHPEIAEKFRKIAEKNDPRGLAAMLRGMAMRDGAEDIASDVNVPVLVVAGSEDAIVSPGEAARTAAAFPSARLQTIEGAGHVPPLEKPEELSACLLDFVSE
jgi:pimeloyl-ACP methyl ester carboxylesterase